MTLRDIIEWILSSGGASVIGYLIVEKVRWPADFPSETKRYIALAIAFVLACLIYVAAVFLTYRTMPVSPIEWIENLVTVGAIAMSLGTLIHGRINLRANDKLAQAERARIAAGADIEKCKTCNCGTT